MKIGAFPLKFCLPADVIISDVLRSFNLRGVDSIGSGKKGKYWHSSVPFICSAHICSVSKPNRIYTHERKFRYIFCRFENEWQKKQHFWVWLVYMKFNSRPCDNTIDFWAQPKYYHELNSSVRLCWDGNKGFWNTRFCRCSGCHKFQVFFDCEERKEMVATHRQTIHHRHSPLKQFHTLYSRAHSCLRKMCVCVFFRRQHLLYFN